MSEAYTIRMAADSATTTLRKLVTGGDADAPARPPSDEAFHDEDYLPAPDIERIATALIASGTLQASAAVHNYRILYRWRRKGGTSRGHPVLGKTTKLSGVARHLSDVLEHGPADFLIWLAADHIRDERLTAYQLEALVYHELLHVGEEEGTGEDAEPKPTLRAHDYEGFRAELAQYGLWRDDLIDMATQVRLL